MAHSNINTEGVRIVMTKAGVAARTQVITSATAAIPSKATSATNNIANNDLVYVPINPTFASLGDGWYMGASSGGTTVDLIGSDTTGDTWATGGTITAEYYKESDFVEVCASSIDMSRNGAETISVATFCNRNDSLKSPITEYGTCTIGGYIDIDSETYKELHAGYLDKQERVFAVVLGESFSQAATAGNYVIAMRGEVAFVDFDLPLDGALAFSAEIKLKTPAQHIVKY